MFRKVKRYWFNLTHPVIGEVWQLHRVTNKHSDTELQRIYEISPQRLEDLIAKYRNKGYIFLSMENVRRIICGENKVKQKFVSVTFDDGYADNYENAYPILKKHKVPFCIYLLQSEVSRDVVCKYPMLTEKQIKELDEDTLCTFGGHTYGHPALAKLNYEQQLEEILKCKDWLEAILGHEIYDYSYPYGSYNQDTINILKKCGIRQCPIAWGGKIRKGKCDPMKIFRRLVTENSID